MCVLILTHTQHQDVHHLIHIGPFESRLSTVLHQLGVRTYRDEAAQWQIYFLHIFEHVKYVY